MAWKAKVGAPKRGGWNFRKRRRFFFFGGGLLQFGPTETAQDRRFFGPSRLALPGGLVRGPDGAEDGGAGGQRLEAAEVQGRGGPGAAHRPKRPGFEGRAGVWGGLGGGGGVYGGFRGGFGGLRVFGGLHPRRWSGKRPSLAMTFSPFGPLRSPCRRAPLNRAPIQKRARKNTKWCFFLGR